MTHTTTIKGAKVLAKHDGSAKTYANRAQAEKAALQSGGTVWQSPQSRVFFVRVKEAA